MIDRVRDAGKIIEVAAADDVRTTDVPKDHVLAYPSRAWSATVKDMHLEIAAVGGSTTQPTRIALTDELASAWAIRAMDAGDVHSVLLATSDDGLALASSSDAGRTWRFERSPSVMADLEQITQDPATGAVMVVTDGDFQSRRRLHYRFDPASPKFASSPTPPIRYGPRCATATTWWYSQLDDHTVRT